MRQQRALRAVDLFCGGGGSSAGARAAGAEIIAGVDADPVAAATYADNFPGAVVRCARLDHANGPEIVSDVGPVDLLLASPECTNHSIARGSRAIDEESRRSLLYFLPFIERWGPSYIILENVTRMRLWDGWHELLRYLNSAGYHIRQQVLDAADFGVPQKRRRLFVLCSRLGLPPEVRPRWQGPLASARTILDPRGTYTARPVVGRNRPLAEKTLERIRRGRNAIPADDFLIVYYGSDAAGGWQALDRPIRTLTTLDRFGLVSGTGPDTSLRMLQVPELRRAMGLPDEFRLEQGSRRDRIRLLGNGVCPPVMQAIVESLTRAELAAVGKTQVHMNVEIEEFPLRLA